MKTMNRLGLTATLVALAAGLAGTLYADQVEEAKKLVKAKNDAVLKAFDAEFLIRFDPGKAACYKEYQAAIQRAKNELTGCINNPTPDSPLGQFNAMSNAQLAAFCGNKTLGQCVNDVHDKQVEFCKAQTGYQGDLDAAKKAEKKCLDCDTLRDKRAALQKEINDINAKLAALRCPR
jgi:hypothetical protein